MFAQTCVVCTCTWRCVQTILRLQWLQFQYSRVQVNLTPRGENNMWRLSFHLRLTYVPCNFFEIQISPLGEHNFIEHNIHFSIIVTQSLIFDSLIICRKSLIFLSIMLVWIRSLPYVRPLAGCRILQTIYPVRP